MIALLRLVVATLLLAPFALPATPYYTVASRKVKRTESYINVPPPPPPPAPTQSHPHSSASSAVAASHHHSDEEPYPYEDIHEHDFHSQPKLVHYEINYKSSPNPTQTHSQSQSQSHHHHHHHTYSHSTHSSDTGGTSNPKFLNDNGLRSIAKGSADQANSAVASQNAAGKQAAYVAKSTLAQAAAQAAGTAVAVLKGKEVLLRRLEEQDEVEHKALEGELAQLQQAKRSAKTAQYAAQQALNHVSILTAALNNAQSASELAQRAASEAAAELASQIDMVAQAKTKLEQIESQLYAARLDYEETKEAAEKATHSAQEAQINANDAAVHANVELSESVHASGTVGGHDKGEHKVEAIISVESTDHHALTGETHTYGLKKK